MGNNRIVVILPKPFIELLGARGYVTEVGGEKSVLGCSIIEEQRPALSGDVKTVWREDKE